MEETSKTTMATEAAAEGQAAGTTEPEHNAGTKADDKVFTQEEVSRMMAKEKSQGRSAALKELGIDPKDTKTLSKLKAFLSQDLEGQAEQADTNAEATIELERRLIAAETKAEAMQLGVKAQFVDDVVALALAKRTDETDVKSVIGEFKAKYPMWFGISETEDGGKVQTKGTGSPIKTTSKNDSGKESLGTRLAASRKAQAKKSSYWNND